MEREREARVLIGKRKAHIQPIYFFNENSSQGRVQRNCFIPAQKTFKNMHETESLNGGETLLCCALTEKIGSLSQANFCIKAALESKASFVAISLLSSNVTTNIKNTF